MFDALKNLGNLPSLMAKAKEMREKMQTMQEELARKQITADAGGGMVEATVNGRLELIRIRIDRQRVNTGDVEMLEDLIVAAVNAAQVKAGQMMQDEMQKVTSDLGLPPGMMP
ncbi:MAG TPA: YbaB/EbfC family nucleoid-associated protein [Humisphaera sp.]|jgi:hypothetical protein|nr:YbaB/EbfC family nucleoid-associated protein [Humisphaera sp.]